MHSLKSFNALVAVSLATAMTAFVFINPANASASPGSDVMAGYSINLGINNQSSHKLALLHEFHTGILRTKPRNHLTEFGTARDSRSTSTELFFPPFTLVSNYFEFKYMSESDPDSWVEIRQGMWGRKQDGVTAHGQLTAVIEDTGWVNDEVVAREVWIRDLEDAQ